ncbi:nascent polypeptide-associated complex protein [Candidatus Micrarchaeota archaeon]|nr:nascent polypeptide-associated complex protein [Candidatus Micrarchaeota archaeon]MBU2476131.1 nascent polypeptide-associated complex protein [Candidatus Micrarchaeota archaeon]
MFPGMGRMNPKQMQGMLKQFGIKSEEIKAKKVVFELEDGSRLIIENPNVSVMNAQGQKIYSVVGNATEEKGLNEEDLKMVIEQTGAEKTDAENALNESNGNIAEAIMKLKKE